jgi:hypothetical protein
MKIIANNDNGDNQAYIHNTSVDYSEYCLHSGANPAFTWSGSISSNTEPTITHNLGYNPIVMASGSLGNVNLNINHYSTSAVTVSNWNSGGNTWSGIILCY